MPTIKLSAIDSTNNFLKGLLGEQKVENFTVVVADYQTNGRGQMGAVWSSEPSKNLMFSVFVNVSRFKLEHPFYISMVVSLAIRKTLNTHLIPQLSIKWPNDILSHHKKVCGILIENVMKQGIVNASIIGVGINVNQTEFKNLPKASSLINLSGKVFDRDEILEGIICNLKKYLNTSKTPDFEAVKAEYESYLFRKNKPSTFKDVRGNLFTGYIQSVEKTGDLTVLLEDRLLKSFSLKDITLMY